MVAESSAREDRARSKARGSRARSEQDHPDEARDCARQGYSPRWTSGDGQISQNSWLKDPNIKEAIAAIYSFPYMDTSTPATKRFNSVMKAASDFRSTVFTA